MTRNLLIVTLVVSNQKSFLLKTKEVKMQPRKQVAFFLAVMMFVVGCATKVKKPNQSTPSLKGEMKINVSEGNFAIRGTLTDSNGNGVKDASVFLWEEIAGGWKRPDVSPDTTTDLNGVFNLTATMKKRYRLEILSYPYIINYPEDGSSFQSESDPQIALTFTRPAEGNEPIEGGRGIYLDLKEIGDYESIVQDLNNGKIPESLGEALKKNIFLQGEINVTAGKEKSEWLVSDKKNMYRIQINDSNIYIEKDNPPQPTLPQGNKGEVSDVSSLSTCKTIDLKDVGNHESIIQDLNNGKIPESLRELLEGRGISFHGKIEVMTGKEENKWFVRDEENVYLIQIDDSNLTIDSFVEIP
jgi:hypothetical protein